ncbi:hypothetical protein DXV76_19635 [Rhodobacteraceae bacterium CCMM004]|nr:hypothetical protein DXV76_19635 [Rhodobacteraceae bacterium CCMM004]
MRLSILAFAVCLPAGAAWALDPSFDCAAAESSAEEAVCANPALAELDLEVSRLYDLAVDGPSMYQARLNELRAIQRGWVKGRDDCWKASVPLERCVAESYAMRIDELRTGYADSRGDDDAGTALGPFAYRCDGLDALVSAVFVNTTDSLVSLRWRDNAVVLARVPSGSGARFAQDYADGRFEFWTQGDEASFQTPAGGALSCVEEPTG